MRKLYITNAICFLIFVLALAKGPDTFAQTTFAKSNNPKACVEILQMDSIATILKITQNRKSPAYLQVSQNSVLTDRNTGIAYALKMLDCNIDPVTNIETYSLQFKPFLDPLASFNFIDPYETNSALFFTGIRKEPLEITVETVFQD